MDEKYIEQLYNQLGGKDKFGGYNDFKELISNNENYRKEFHSQIGEKVLGDYNSFDGLVKKKDGGNVAAQSTYLGTASPSAAQSQSKSWESNPINPASGNFTQKPEDKKVDTSGRIIFDLNDKGQVVMPTKKADNIEAHKEAVKNNPDNRGGYIGNKLLRGIGELITGATDNAMNAALSLLPESVIGGTKEEAMKQWRKEVSPISREFFEKNLGDKTVTEKQKDKYDNELITSSIGGIAQSLPAMLSPKGAKAIALISQAEDAALQSINSTEQGKALPESTKSVFISGVGVAQGLIEKFGLDKIFGKQSSALSRKIAGKVFADLLKTADSPITKEMFDEALEVYTKSAKQQLLNAVKKLGTAGGIEFVTGTLQEGSTIFAEILLNKGVGKDIFEPTSWGKAIGRSVKAGLQEAIGGFVLGGVTVPFSKVDNYISDKVSQAKSSEDIDVLKVELEQEMDRLGAFDEDSKNEVRKLIDDYTRVNSKIPDSVPNRKFAADKIIERENIEQEIESKIAEKDLVDVAFQPEIQTEIDLLSKKVEDINNELVNPNTVTEDAIPNTTTQAPAPTVDKPIIDATTTAKEQGGEAAVQQSTEPTGQGTTKTTDAVLEGSGGLNKEAMDLLKSVGEGSMPTFITKNLEKIASDNGIEVTGKMTATDVVNALKEKQKSEQPLPTKAETKVEETPPASKEYVVKKTDDYVKDKTDNISLAKEILNDLGVDATFTGFSDTNGVSVYFENANGQKIRVSDHDITNKDRVKDEISLRFDSKRYGGGIYSKFEQNKKAVESLLSKEESPVTEVKPIVQESKEVGKEEVSETKESTTNNPASSSKKEESEKGKVDTKKEGKYEAKAKAIAEKIMAAKVVPDWLKIDDENISTKGSSAEDLKKVLADAVINMGKLLDKGVEFSQALRESVKGMIDIHGEVKRKEIEAGFEKYYRENEADAPPPKKPPVETTNTEGEGSRKKRKYGILSHLMDAKEVPQSYKEGLKEKGLEYEVSNQAEAQQAARGIIDSIGREQALDAARDGLLDPSVGSAVFGEALNDMYKQERELRTSGKVAEADLIAQEWADTSYEYAKISNSGGKWNSQIAYFYKSSPMGIALRQKQQNAETFNEWFKDKEVKWKEVFEEMKKDPEFDEVFNEEVRERMKKERAESRKARIEKVDKIFDDAIDKFKSSGATYSTLIPPPVITAALKGLKKAYHAGENIAEAVQQAIDYISTELKGADWDKEKFRKEWEGKLGNGRGYKESDTKRQKRIEYLRDELKRIKERKNKEPKEKKESTREIPDDEKALLDEIEKEQSIWDEEKKKSPEWINKKAKQFLDNFKKKMEGMDDEQRKKVIQKSVNKLSENGALEYDEFKQIIAESIGIKEFTDEQVKQVEQYVEDINKEQDAEDAMVESPSQKNNEDYIKAREKAIEAQHNLFQLTNKKSDITGTIRAWITGSLLGVPTLIKNVAQNVLFQSQIRFPKAVVRQLAELSMYAMSKALPGSRTYQPKTNLLLAQKGYFGMGKKGVKRGLFLFNKGLQEKDYNSRTAYQTNLSPRQAARELKLAKAGELFLTKTEKIDRYIRKSIFARQADFILRAMGLGDNPQRYAAEGSAAIQIGRNELGITSDIEMEAFLLAPEKYSYKVFIKEGKSTKDASELSKEIKTRISNEGDKAVLQEENLMSKVSALADQGLKIDKEDSPLTKAAKGIGAVGKTQTFPFVKIPANVYWNMLKTVNPQLTLVYAVSQAAVAAKYRKQGNFAKANEYMNKSSDNAALAIVGYGMGIAVTSLITNGLVRSSNDKEDKKRETEGERVFGKQNELNLGKLFGGDDYWVDLSWFGPFGTMIDVKARIYEDDLEKKNKGEKVDDSFFGELVDNATYSLSSSLNTLVFDQASKTLDVFTNSRGSALDRAGSTYLTNLTNTLGNMFTGATFTALSKAALPEQARLKGDNVIEGIVNNQKQRDVFVRWAAGMPKSRISIWGEPIKNDRTVMGILGSVLGFERGSENKFGAILYDDARRTGDNRFFPNPEDNKITVKGNKYELTQKEKDDLDIEVGAARKALVQAFVYDKSKTYDEKTYSQITDDKEKVRALSIIYDLGREIGFNKFLSNNSKFVPSETELDKSEESKKEVEKKDNEFKKQLSEIE